MIPDSSSIIVTYSPDYPHFTRKWVNEVYCRLFGVTSEQVIGKSCLDSTPEESRAEVVQKIQQCIERDEVLTSFEANRKPDGTVLLFRWVEVPVKGENGRIEEMIAIGIPLPDRRAKTDRRKNKPG
jgi:PAS domain S-box-containing protein